MSQENVEAFKRAVDAINRGDVEASLKELDQDVEFHAFMEELLGGEGRVYMGYAGVRGSTATSANTSTSSTGSTRTSATSATGFSQSAPSARVAEGAAPRSKRRSAS